MGNSPENGLGESTLTVGPSDRARTGGEHAYFVIFEGDSATSFTLPDDGEVLIGRGDEASLRIPDQAVSRRHAIVVVNGGQAVVRDLGSRNGTTVNGEQLGGATSASGPGTASEFERELSTGDVIVISNTMLAYHAHPSVSHPALGLGGPGRSSGILDLPAFRKRVVDEIEGAHAAGTAFSVVALDLGTTVDRVKLWEILQGVLRPVDVPAWDGPGQLLILLPGIDGDQVAQLTNRLSEALRHKVPQVRLGLVCFPGDGHDVTTLLRSVRQASRTAAPGGVSSSSNIFSTLELPGHRVIIADSTMVRVHNLVERLSQVDLTVLIYGETGTGKEIVASALHHKSLRKNKPFLTVNCAAIHENLLESELFGYERGAFTGANGSKPGLLETAHGGSVFLDEVGEMSASAQAKLLRVLETKRVTRLGDVKEREIDIRLLAATNRNLQAEVRGGRFRQDLFYRLSGATLYLPPLRDRKRELRLLAEAFLVESCRQNGRDAVTISPAAMDRLIAHRWTGNIRELKNAMGYFAATQTTPKLEAWDVSEYLSRESEFDQSSVDADDLAMRPMDEVLRELERRRMAAMLSSSGAPGVPSDGRGGIIDFASRAGRAGSSSGAPAAGAPQPTTPAGAAGALAGVPAHPSVGAPTGTVERAVTRPPVAPTTRGGFRPVADEMKELERSRMEAALRATGGHRTRAAELIGMPLRTFLAKLKSYHLSDAPTEMRRSRHQSE